MMRTSQTAKWTAAALAAGMMTAPAMADLLVYDSFEIGDGAYQVGTRLDQNPNRSAPATEGAWTDAWQDVTQYEAVADGLSYERNGQTLEGSGGAVTNLPRGGSVGNRPFEAQAESTTYFSAMFHADTLNPSAGATERMVVGLASSTVARMATLRIRADGQVQTDTYNVIEPREFYLNENQTYLLVGEISFGEGETDDDRMLYANYWISPNLNGAPGEGAIASFSFEELIDVNHAYVDALTLWSHSAFSGDFRIDELRVGTTYSSVIPEPTSVALLGLGALGLMARRRLQTV